MEHIQYVYLSERITKEGEVETRHPYLCLGNVMEFSTARMIVGAIRTIALTTGHPELIEYALELTKCLIEWDKKLPPPPAEVAAVALTPTLPGWPAGAHR